MIFVKSASDCGPLKNSPLMKKVGVALTPAWEPASTSRCTTALYLPDFRQDSKEFWSRPSPAAVLTKATSSSFDWSANLASYISQYFPCARAQREASAAISAC